MPVRAGGPGRQVDTMNCEIAKNYVTLLHDGRLGATDAEAVRRHLEACPSCAAEKRRLERLDAVMREYDAPKPSAALNGRILAAVAANAPAKTGKTHAPRAKILRMWRWAVPAAVAAAALLAAVLLWPGTPEKGGTTPEEDFVYVAPGMPKEVAMLATRYLPSADTAASDLGSWIGSGAARLTRRTSEGASSIADTAVPSVTREASKAFRILELFEAKPAEEPSEGAATDGRRVI